MALSTSLSSPTATFRSGVTSGASHQASTASTCTSSAICAWDAHPPRAIGTPRASLMTLTTRKRAFCQPVTCWRPSPTRMVTLASSRALEDSPCSDQSQSLAARSSSTRTPTRLLCPTPASPAARSAWPPHPRRTTESTDRRLGNSVKAKILLRRGF